VNSTLRLALAAAALISCSGAAFGVGVTLFGANSFDSLDVSDGTRDGVFRVSGNLTLESGASILCNDAHPGGAGPCPIRIAVTGVMELKPGSAILAENTAAAGAGGDITIVVEGASLTLDGQSGATPGAIISSRKDGAADKASAGDIRIMVGDTTCAAFSGDLEVLAGALITADGIGEAGSISLASGHAIAIDGSVSSSASKSTGRGGPISIVSCGAVRNGSSGIVRSQGGGSGADLVHLEGSAIEVLGIVESAGSGSPGKGKNLCNPSGKPANSIACVELLSGSFITIDATGAANGEVRADTSPRGDSNGTGWIDLLAFGPISIRGGSSPPYAVHANQGQNNGHGGVLTVQTAFGQIVTSGGALQANDTAGGGRGGLINVQATFSSVDFGSASVQAMGASSGGPGKAGGHISAGALGGDLTGSSPGELNASGGPGSGNGTLALMYCHTLAYTGAEVPAAVSTKVCP
jgi:hypothetical protein